MTLVPSLALALSALGSSAPATVPSPGGPAFQDPDPTQEYWSDVARALTERRGVAAVLPVDAAAVALRARLAETQVAGLTLSEEESLTEVFSMVQAMTGLPILVDPRAENAALDEGVLFEVNWPNPITTEQALDLITDLAGESVDWTVRGEVVLVTSAERALDAREMYLHPIADLFETFEADEVAMMVQENVYGETWEAEGVAIEPAGAFLLVVHTRETQLAAEAFLSDLRSFQASLAAPPSYEPTVAEREHNDGVARLETVRFVPRFGVGGDGVPLTEVTAFLQELTGMNFVVSRRVLEDFDDEELAIQFDLPETSVRDVLDLIVETREQLRWTVEDNLVRIATLDEERDDAIFALYDVRGIVSPADPDHVGGFAVGGDELEALVLSSDMLEDLIRNQIEPESWDATPDYSLRITGPGVMTVAQSPAVHARIRELLSNLNEIARIQLEVRAKYERGR